MKVARAHVATRLPGKVLWALLCTTCLSVSGFADTVSARAAGEQPNAEDIFQRALTTWAAQPEPPYLSYRVTTRLARKGRLREERESVIFRSADRTGVVEQLPAPVHGDATPPVHFGRPRYIPDVAFALIPRLATSYNGESEAPGPTPTQTPLATIGHVTAKLKRYALTLVGAETYQDHPVYHLRLEPLFNPGRNRVREMWIDSTTFVTWRLVAEAPFSVGPARGNFLLNAEYAPVEGTWMIRRVSTSGALRFGFLSYGGDATLEFSSVTANQHIEKYCFDASGFRAHAAECSAAFAT